MNKNKHPRDESSFLSKFFTTWLLTFAKKTKMILSGSGKLLYFPKTLQIEGNLIDLEHHWENEAKRANPRFYNAIKLTYGKEYLVKLVPLSIAMTCNLIQALLINEFILNLGSNQGI